MRYRALIFDFDGTIAGVRVTEHRETPGLGDKVDLKKSDWILDFDGKSLVNPEKSGWDVKKNGGAYDQFTGATITPRAVIHQIAKTLEYFTEDSERLLIEAAKSKSDLELIGSLEQMNSLERIDSLEPMRIETNNE